MALREEASDQRERKQYLMACDGCSLDQTVDGREEVEQVADAHRRETGHEIVVVEWPRSTTPP